VVAICGNRCLYYEDIEEGFNWSRCAAQGVIDEHWCDEDKLEQALVKLPRSDVP
jgi:hypothetical protein